MVVPLIITCPGIICSTNRTCPGGPVLKATAPAVWPEPVAVHEVMVLQFSAPGVPGGPEALLNPEPKGLEVVVLLELEAQPPELPLTLN